MARKVAALVLFFLLGLAFTEAASIIPKTVTAPSPSEGIGNEAEGGTTPGGFAEAGPVGGLVPDGLPDTPTDPSTDASPPPKKNGASNLDVSSIASVAIVGFSLFYF